MRCTSILIQTFYYNHHTPRWRIRQQTIPHKHPRRPTPRRPPKLRLQTRFLRVERPPWWTIRRRSCPPHLLNRRQPTRQSHATPRPPPRTRWQIFIQTRPKRRRRTHRPVCRLPIFRERHLPWLNHEPAWFPVAYDRRKNVGTVGIESRGARRTLVLRNCVWGGFRTSRRCNDDLGDPRSPRVQLLWEGLLD